MNISPQNLIWQPAHAPTAPTLKAIVVGVLALQGDFLEHANMLRRLGVTPKEVRLPQDLIGLAGLIIPGGESTTIGKLATKFGLVEPLQQFIASTKPVWGTCAGMIFLAKEVGATGSGGHVVPLRLGSMDIVVNRNAFGRQVDSFEADLQLKFDGNVPFRAVFIRAPSIESCGPGVEALAHLPNGTPVAARQNNLLVSAFHPELTNDVRLHRYFLDMVLASQEVNNE